MADQPFSFFHLSVKMCSGHARDLLRAVLSRIVCHYCIHFFACPHPSQELVEPNNVFYSICIIEHSMQTTWGVLFHPEEFEPEFAALPEDVQDELLAMPSCCSSSGPQLDWPRADTLVAPVTRT